MIMRGEVALIIAGATVAQAQPVSKEIIFDALNVSKDLILESPVAEDGYTEPESSPQIGLTTILFPRAAR